MKANAPKRKVFQDAVDLLGMPEAENAPVSNGITMIPVEKIVPFHNHPFRLYEGECQRAWDAYSGNRTESNRWV